MAGRPGRVDSGCHARPSPPGRCRPGRPRGARVGQTSADRNLSLAADPDMTALYDSRRDLTYAKPLLRGWLHLVWFEASLVAGVLLAVATRGPRQAVAVGVYATCLSGLLGVSALYHRGTWGPAARAALQRADTVMIFLLIAGTATPVLLLGVPPAVGLPGMVVLWSLTALGIGARLARMDAPEWLVGSSFVGLGTMNALAIPALWANQEHAGAVLLLAGGVLFVVGAVGYHHRRPDPFPAVFGYHEVFHAFVCAATACHFAAVALLIG